jgi:hypothetical protein
MRLCIHVLAGWTGKGLKLSPVPDVEFFIGAPLQNQELRAATGIADYSNFAFKQHAVRSAICLVQIYRKRRRQVRV